MNNLTKEKKQQLVLVAIFTVVILIGVWFGLVNTQQKKREAIDRKTADMKKQIADAEKLLARKEEIQEVLEKNEQELRQRETTLPPVSSAYTWLISVVNEYIKPPSQLSNFITSTPTVGEVGIIPKFPYRAVSYNPVTLSGFFVEFGKFLADFENDWPYLRVQNLNMTPASGLPGDEKLSFQFEVVSLTLTNQTTLTK